MRTSASEQATQCKVTHSRCMDRRAKSLEFKRATWTTADLSATLSSNRHTGLQVSSDYLRCLRPTTDFPLQLSFCATQKGRKGAERGPQLPARIAVRERHSERHDGPQHLRSDHQPRPDRPCSDPNSPQKVWHTCGNHNASQTHGSCAPHSPVWKRSPIPSLDVIDRLIARSHGAVCAQELLELLAAVHLQNGRPAAATISKIKKKKKKKKKKANCTALHA